MTIKAFSFTVRTNDPRPLDLSVSTHVYKTGGGVMERIALVGREMGEEDILDFDAEFGDTFNVSYNDLIHGEYSITVMEGEASAAPLLKIYLYDDRVRGDSGVLFRVVGEGGETIYVDNVYFSSPLRTRIARVARLLGVPQRLVEEEVKRLGGRGM